MNYIAYALDRIFREVPEELLYRAFGQRAWNAFGERLSLEAMIRGEVIEKILLTDCNIVGGEETTVRLDDLPYQLFQDGTRVEIPLSRTQGRQIHSVLSIEQTLRNGEPPAVMEGQPGSTGTTEVYLSGPNIIFTPLNLTFGHCFLRCLLMNDPQLANFHPGAMRVFGKMAVLAARGAIYNKLAINTTITAMSGGQVDGRLRSIIDNYADAFEQYEELLNTRWRKISIMQDRLSHARLIRKTIVR